MICLDAPRGRDAHMLKLPNSYVDLSKERVMRWIAPGIIAVAMVLLPLAAQAQDQDQAQTQTGPLEATLMVEAVTVDQESGEETLVQAASAGPGTVLQYTGLYSNVSDDPLTGIIVRGPVPENTTFIPENLSASEPSEFEVLVEGEPWQTLPAYKTVTKEDGTTERVEALPSDYMEIRWRLTEPLEPDVTLTTIYRVRIDS